MIDRIKKKFRNWQKSRLASSIAEGNMAHIKNFFASNPSEINDPIQDNDTALHIAARTRWPGLVDFLLRNGANPNIPSTNGDTALHIAADNQQTEICQILINAGANPALKNDQQLSAIDIFSFHGMEKLAIQCIETSKEAGFSLHLAALSGEVNLTKILIEKGVNIHSLGHNGLTPLQNAVTANFRKTKKSKIAIVDALLEKGAFPNTPSQPPLHLEAASSGNERVIDMLLNHGANPGQKDENGKTPLHLAATAGNIDAILCLLKSYPIGINEQDRNGNTALHLAAANVKGIQVLAPLINAGVDIDLKNISGKTALDLIPKEFKNAAIISFLSKAHQSPRLSEFSLTEDGVIWQRIHEKNLYGMAEIFNFSAAKKTSIFKDLTVKTSFTQSFDHIPFAEIEWARDMREKLKNGHKK